MELAFKSKMKKLLGIVVLGLLLSGNAYAKSLPGKKFNLDRCNNNSSSSANFEINLNTQTVVAKIDYTNDSIITVGNFRIKEINNNIISTHKIKLSQYFGRSNFKDHTYEAIKATTVELKIDVQSKIVLDEWKAIYPNTNNRLLKKGYDEMFQKKNKRILSVNWNCYNLAVLDKKKVPKVVEKPKKQKPDDDKIVAAASGTGFFVSRSGHIISNHHVIEGCDTTKLTFKGKEVVADVLAVDKMNDLAILKANLIPNQVYPVANEDAALLEDIIIAGYPLGKKVSAAIKTSKGSVTALAGYGDNYSEFQTDAALNQGNSGGPIMIVTGKHFL